MKYLIPILLLIACVKPNSSIQPAVGCGENTSTLGKEITGPRLIVFGDSISERSGFAELLGDELGLDVWNMAVGGSDLSCQITKIEAFEYVDGDKVLFLVGLNDARLGRSAQELGVYMQRALTKWDGLDVILGTTMKMLGDQYARHTPHDKASDASIEEYSDYLLSLGSASVSVVNVTDAWVPDEANYLSDRVHPNSVGAQLLFTIFRDSL